VDVEARATVTGIKVALSGTINNIETPVSGWDGVINIEDADLGQTQETDGHLRLKREAEIRALGNASKEAIRGAVLRVPGVSTVTVFENDSEFTVDGIPPFSIEVMVEGGEDDDIRQAIYDTKAAGAGTFGNETGGVVTDSQGFDHEIDFTRPTDLEIYVEADVTVQQGLFPVDGADQIKQAIVDYGDAQLSGKNVVASGLVAAIFTVPGIIDVTSVRMSAAPTTDPTVSTTINIEVRQRAEYDSSRIEVTTVNGIP
jgi:uncharacterized phage protein gp47/JayE